MIDCLSENPIPPESPDGARGRRAYEVYRASLAQQVEAGGARSGEGPAWEGLPNLIRGAWVAVGRAMREES